jgi:glutamyl endopeptidase
MQDQKEIQMKKFKSVFAYVPKRALLWCTLSLATTPFVASAQAVALNDDPNELPISTRGVMPMASLSAEIATAMNPFKGTGKASEVASFALLAPSGPDVRGLPPVSGPIGTESVIGADTRIRTYTTYYPARAVALITFDAGYCTGWFYGPNVVATAGHCVHSGPGGSWQTNVRVWPGYNAGSSPYGSYPAKWVASVAGWINSGDERYDYGVVKLSSNVGNTVGWFGSFWQTATLTGLPSTIVGYAGDKAPSKSQWLSVDLVRVTQDRQVFYKNDTFGGQSGSAVWQDRPAGSPYCANGPCTYAIHAYGLHGSAPHSDHNHGTRIVQAVFNNLVSWKNAP